MYLIILLVAVLAGTAYLWQIHRAVHATPTEAARLVQQQWTQKELQNAYRKVQSNPIDIKPYLFRKKNRRYIVVGGSGHVGGWIVQHLLMRGENPDSIRIVDLRAPKRPAIVEHNLSFKPTDVSDATAVLEAFQAPWPDSVQSLPLTIFHCVAYINVSERSNLFLAKYEKVNIGGTKNALDAARKVGASVFVVTSSASINLTAPTYFPWPKNLWQIVPNKPGESLTRPKNEFVSNYSWSKATAEHLVLQANNPTAGFLTGSIRPGQVIYGSGGINEWSFTWDCLRRGGSPTWLRDNVVNGVDAQNVSIGHLAYEDALINSKAGSNPGGKGYVVTDPNPPVTYGHIYDGVTKLAHPLTPAPFPAISILVVLFPAYLFELYRLARVRVPFLNLLPDLKGDAAMLMPSMIYTSGFHTLMDDTQARQEIGYRAPIQTIDGVAMAVLEWNNKVEQDSRSKIDAGRAAEVKVQSPGVVPQTF